MKAPDDNPLLDRLLRTFLYPYFTLLHGYRWYGVENVPRRGPAILAANHQSFLDPILIGLAAGRRIVFMGWQYYYNWPVLGPLMRLQDTIPVDIDTPGPSTIGRLLRVLEQGRLCGIFPEGGRTFDGLLGEPKAGVAALALRSGAPVIPVTISGAFRAWPRGQFYPVPARISAYFGAPFRVDRADNPRGTTDRERRREVAFDLMRRIADGFRKLGRPDVARASLLKLRALAGDSRRWTRSASRIRMP